MKKEIRYIELKSGFSDNGPAWIGEVTFSKSGSTIYFNKMALKKLKTSGLGSNHFDIETGDEYWISGVKKNGLDRHLAGGGKVLIDEDIVSDYLGMVSFDSLDKSKYEIIKIEKSIDKSRFDKLENESGISSVTNQENYHKWYWDNNRRKLVKE